MLDYIVYFNLYNCKTSINKQKVKFHFQLFAIIIFLGLLTTLLCYYFEMVKASRYADQLYEDLMYFYNKNVRPVKNTSEPLRVKFGASLIRIIDVVKFIIII